jgi:20S proteasome alpha/beta subunit
MTIVLSDDIKYIIEDTAEIEPLTTVIGIKSKDGIILASDSQFTAERMKFLGGSKIFKINDFVALGAAGSISQMAMLADALKQKLGETIFSDLELRTKIEDVLLELHKNYNLRWSKALEKTTYVFNPSSIVGAKLNDGSFKLYRIFFNPEPWLEPVEIYESVGSGQLFASLVLRQQSRAPNSLGQTLADIELNYNIMVACIVINEIKGFDTYSGGSTKVAVIYKDGIIFIPDKKVKEIYNEAVNDISSSLSQALTSDTNKITKEKVEHLFPKDE